MGAFLESGDGPLNPLGIPFNQLKPYRILLLLSFMSNNNWMFFQLKNMLALKFYKILLLLEPIKITYEI